MFEELIFAEKNKIQILLDQSDYIQVSNITNNNEYPLYLRQYLKGLMFEQITKLKTDLVINYNININDLEINDQWRIFEDACYEFYKLEYNKIDEIILNAVELNLNYTIRPKQTLINFLFRDELYQSTINLKNRLHYFDLKEEIISKISIWLDEQDSTISIFQFRNITSSIISNLFKENKYSIVANWFENLIKSLETIKFNPENSIFSILSIFSSDLNWNGLQQFLNTNKKQYLNKILSKSSIEDCISNYLACWLKDSSAKENSDDLLNIEQESELESNLPESDTIGEIADIPNQEVDEYDKILREESFEGEEESYDLDDTAEGKILDEKLSEQSFIKNDELKSLDEFDNQSENTETAEQINALQDLDDYDKLMAEISLEGEGETYENLSAEELDEEIDENNENITIKNNVWDEFSQNSNDDSKILDDENIRKIDEIIGEFGQTEQIATEQTNRETEETNEEDEFERLASMIASGEDVAQDVVTHTPTDNKVEISTENFAEINNLINNLNDKLNQNIKETQDLHDYREFAKQTRLADLNFIDINTPEFTKTKKELYELLIELKKRKAL